MGGFGFGGFVGGGSGGGNVGVGGGSFYGVEGSYGGGGRGLFSFSSYDKDSYGDVVYGIGDMKGLFVSDRNFIIGMFGVGVGNFSFGYDGMSNVMVVVYGYGVLLGGFGGFFSIGDWS